MRTDHKVIPEGSLRPVRFVRIAGIVAAVAYCFFGDSTPANAASDGVIGSSSEGEVVISVSIPALVRISDLEDVEFGAWDGTQSMSRSDDVCVWSSSRGYSLTGVGNNGGAFALADESGNQLPYSVAWETSNGEKYELAAGQTQSAMASTTRDVGCADDENMAVMTIDIAQEDLAATQSGAYSGVLSLTVASE